MRAPPVTRPGTPRSGVAHQRGGLPGTRVVSETVEQLLDPLAHGRIESGECLPGRITEDELVCHGLSAADFGLDLLPRAERLSRLDACTVLAGSVGVGEVFQQLAALPLRPVLLPF